MTETDRRDAELVRRTLAGDRDAFEVLVQNYHHHLWRLLNRMTRHTEDTEDLVQETFLRAFRALDRFDLSLPFRPWLVTIAMRRAMHLIKRKDRQHVSIETAATTPDDEHHWDGSWLASLKDVERLDGELLRHDLLKALDTVEPRFRAVFLLRVMEDRTYEEIATTLDIPKGTVMSRLSRARSRLREILGDQTRQGETDEQPV